MIVEYPYNTDMLDKLISQKNEGIKNSYYHYTQIQFAYNSNHIEGSTLTPDQTEAIYDKGTISGTARVNEIIEMRNHFRLFDYMLDTIEKPLSEELIKRFHGILQLSLDENCGNYKTAENQIGFISPVTTAKVKDVPQKMAELLAEWSGADEIKLWDIAALHAKFESIHPFQDGNGRVGRMIMFRECIRNRITPFIVYDHYRSFYISGLNNHRGGNEQQLVETLNMCQEIFYQNFMYFFGDEEKLVTPDFRRTEFNAGKRIGAAKGRFSVPEEFDSDKWNNEITEPITNDEL